MASSLQEFQSVTGRHCIRYSLQIHSGQLPSKEEILRTFFKNYIIKTTIRNPLYVIRFLNLKGSNLTLVFNVTNECVHLNVTTKIQITMKFLRQCNNIQEREIG